MILNAASEVAIREVHRKKGRKKIERAKLTIAELLAIPLWTTTGFGLYISTPEETVRYWRRTGLGPKFIRLTPRKIRYRREDVLEWLANNTRCSTDQSISQVGQV